MENPDILEGISSLVGNTLYLRDMGGGVNKGELRKTKT